MSEYDIKNDPRRLEVNLCPKCGLQRALKKNGKRQPKPVWYCPKCAYKALRPYRDKNAERMAAYRKARYASDPERFRADRRAHYRKNPGAGSNYQRKYIAENREKVRAVKKRWAMSEKGRELTRESSRRTRVRYPEKRKEMALRWIASPTGKISRERSAHARRAAKRRVPGKVSSVEIAALREIMRSCYYCGGGKTLTLDHVAALAIGGPHSLENLVVSCKCCNSKKTYLTPMKWAEKTGMCIFPMEERFYASPFPRLTTPPPHATSPPAAP